MSSTQQEQQEQQQQPHKTILTNSPSISPTTTTSSSSSSSTTSSSNNNNNNNNPINSQQLLLTSHTCTCPPIHTQHEPTRYSSCPVCLSKFDLEKPPITLTSCSHILCLQCTNVLIPSSCNVTNDNCIVINPKIGSVNYPLLAFLDYNVPPEHQIQVNNSITSNLIRISRLIRSHTVSRSIHRKTIILISSFVHDPAYIHRLYKPVKSLGERSLVELTSSCSHLSHYHAQQQLWAAIRARACQFMGPAMQDEALKLVLLALEDGSALSRKVLVMFVVQRLAPQFPQASKTSVGHIVQLLYRASAFDVLKRESNSSLMTLRPEFRNYEALRREHDTQIMKIGIDAGIRFTPEQWSSLLYGDTSQKPLMQSIIDKLQSPQTFQELLKEYVVSVQRLSNPDSQFLISLHPHFKLLSMINTDPQQQQTQQQQPQIESALDSLHSVLVGLITFTANRKHQRSQRHNNNSSNSTGNNSSSNNTNNIQVYNNKQVYNSQNQTMMISSSSDNNSTTTTPTPNNNNLTSRLSNLCVN